MRGGDLPGLGVTSAVLGGEAALDTEAAQQHQARGGHMHSGNYYLNVSVYIVNNYEVKSN